MEVSYMAVLYVTWMVVILPSFDFLDAFIILGGLSAFHILVFLFTVWSVDFKCFIQYSKLAGSSTDEIFLIFRKQCFIYLNEKNTFFKLPYPSKETFGYHLKSTGHGTEAKVQVAAEKWVAMYLSIHGQRFRN